MVETKEMIAVGEDIPAIDIERVKKCTKEIRCKVKSEEVENHDGKYSY